MSRGNSKGDRVGDYVLGETLGQGSFGTVKCAIDTKDGRKVAIKIVDKASIANVEDVERVYRETFILTTLKHKNIIRLYEVIDSPSAIMIVMEYAGGGELLAFVKEKGSLTEVECCDLFQQIVDGVDYCHRAKIIHRDLKLENILMDEEGNVKIADFGLSNLIKIGQKLSTSCGTPSYTCPEAIVGQEYIGEGADMWSLGVILFAMAAGFVPFEANNLPNLFWKIRRALFKCPSFLSNELKDMIAGMLTVEPDKRMTVSEVKCHPWYLMRYSNLETSLREIPPPSESEIQLARCECKAVGDEALKHTRAAEASKQKREAAAKKRAEKKALMSFHTYRLASTVNFGTATSVEEAMKLVKEMNEKREIARKDREREREKEREADRDRAEARRSRRLAGYQSSHANGRVDKRDRPDAKVSNENSHSTHAQHQQHQQQQQHLRQLTPEAPTTATPIPVSSLSGSITTTTTTTTTTTAATSASTSTTAPFDSSSHSTGLPL